MNNRWDKLTPDLQNLILQYRLQRGVEPEYYKSVNFICDPKKNINSLTKQDLINCIVNRYFFVSPKYIHLQGRIRYTKSIDGEKFLIMLHRLFELGSDNDIDTKSLVKIIYYCLKTPDIYKLGIDLTNDKKYNKITYIQFDNILDELDELNIEKYDYHDLTKNMVKELLSIFNKDTLFGLYSTINKIWIEEPFVFD